MRKIEKIIKITAKNNNSTDSNVKKEISYAINCAIANSKGNYDAEAFWKKLTKNKAQPTPEDLITAIIEKVLTNNKGKL